MQGSRRPWYTGGGDFAGDPAFRGEHRSPGARHCRGCRETRGISNGRHTVAVRFVSRRPNAPGRALIDAGAAVALGTNFNPNHTPMLNMQTVVSLACMRMDLTPAEAISAATINGAHALDCADRVGSLEFGKSADLVILNVSDYADVVHHFGMNLVHATMKRGKFIYREAEVGGRSEATRSGYVRAD